jgi:hypothetical protein
MWPVLQMESEMDMSENTPSRVIIQVGAPDDNK